MRLLACVDPPAVDWFAQPSQVPLLSRALLTRPVPHFRSLSLSLSLSLAG